MAASNDDEPRNDRKSPIGEAVLTIRNGIDKNLQLLRLGCIVAVIGSVGLIARASGKVKSLSIIIVVHHPTLVYSLCECK